MRPLFVVCLLLALLVRKGHAIGCYTCVSKNNDNEACDKGWSSAGFTRDCRTEAGQQANYCFKIEGQGMNMKGPVTIRGCHAQRWNTISNSDQPIQYMSFNIIGRVLSCDSNYCNSSPLLAPKMFLLLALSALAYAVGVKRKFAL